MKNFIEQISINFRSFYLIYKLCCTKTYQNIGGNL